MAKPSLTMFDSNLRHSCKSTGGVAPLDNRDSSDLDCGPLGKRVSPDTSTLEHVTYSDMRAILLRMHQMSGNLYYLLETEPGTARYTPSAGVSGAFHALMRDCSQLLLNDGMLDRHPL